MYECGWLYNFVNIIIMGCDCLGPKKSQEQVFLKLIKSIHEESDKIATEHIQADLYSALTERISKKGELRKLTDNLSSRRHRIHDAMAFNYILATQSKELGHWQIGLMITDSITEVIYPMKNSHIQDNLCKSDESSQTNLNRNSSFTKSSQPTLKKKNQNHNFHQTQYSAVDQQYFKIIKFLYSLDEKLKKRILESINKFCFRHVGVIACETQLWDLINKMVEDLRNGIQNEACSFALKNLMLRTRDQISEKMRNREILQTLLLLWLNQQKNTDKSELSQNCFQILSIYFDRFISAWQSDFLLESMFSVLDKIEFDPKIQPLLQKLCENLIESSELKRNFLRSLFNYLLGYLSISLENLNSSRKRWLLTSLGIKIENTKNLFKNVLIPSVKIKIEGLKRTNVWIDKSYIDINEFCLYNNKVLVYVYMSILVPFVEQIVVKEQILQEFKKTVQKLTNSRQEMLLQTALEQFQSEQISIKQQQSILVLIKQVIKRISWDKKNRSLFENIDFFIPVYVKFPHEKKLEIINLNCFLLTVVDLSGNLDDTSLSIADLMYTFYANITSQDCSFAERYQILNRHIQYLRDFSHKCKQSTLAAYYDVICQNSSQNVKNFNIEIQFCLLWLGFAIRKLVSDEQIPIRLTKLKKSIDSRNNKIESLPELNQYFFNKDKLVSLQNTDQWNDYVDERRIFLNAFSSKGGDRKDSTQRKQGFLRRSNSEIKTDHDDQNDRSFAQAIQIIGMK